MDLMQVTALPQALEESSQKSMLVVRLSLSLIFHAIYFSPLEFHRKFKVNVGIDVMPSNVDSESSLGKTLGFGMFEL